MGKVRDGEEGLGGWAAQSGQKRHVMVTRPPTAPLRGFSLEKSPRWSKRDGEEVRDGEEGSGRWGRFGRVRKVREGGPPRVGRDAT